MRVLDLFSAAAGGWSLGMHRAGFTTVAACEFEAWRRALYSENNPNVPIYDDVRTLTAARLAADGIVPDIVVGSPPCQDISSANTNGKGVEGARSGLFFEAVRIIGEVRPRWFALENSANLRTRGADRVLGELEGLGYACWAFVVGGDNIGANHERKRSWLIGCDVSQLADASRFGRNAWAGSDESPYARSDGRQLGYDDGDGAAPDAHGLGRHEGRSGRGSGLYVPVSEDPLDPAGLRHEGGRTRGHGPDGDGASPASGRERDGACAGQVGLRAPDRGAAVERRADWSLDDLARHIRLDDGLPAWVADTRIAVGGPRGTSAASLVVEAFGDSVLPQIPEAIGRAILRTERAYAALTDQERAA